MGGLVISERAGSSCCSSLDFTRRAGGNPSTLGIPLYCESTEGFVLFFLVCLFDSILTTAALEAFFCFFSFLLPHVGLSATFLNVSFTASSATRCQNILTLWNISVRRRPVISIVAAELLPVMFNYRAASLHWQVISPFRFGSLLMMLLKWLRT